MCAIPGKSPIIVLFPPKSLWSPKVFVVPFQALPSLVLYLLILFSSCQTLIFMFSSIDSNIIKYQTALKQQLKKQREKEKAIYAGMFDKINE